MLLGLRTNLKGNMIGGFPSNSGFKGAQSYFSIVKLLYIKAVRIFQVIVIPVLFVG